VAILAELVQFRAAGRLEAPAAIASAPSSPAEAIDPVCGMTVRIEGARHRLERGGETFYFCCAGCLTSFEATQEETGHGDPSRERVHSSGVHG
jgi:YHS domain-containing protein